VLEPYRKAAKRWGAAHFFDKSSQIPEMLRVLRGMRSSHHASSRAIPESVEAEPALLRARDEEAG
jgi:hypothetical protein